MSEARRTLFGDIGRCAVRFRWWVIGTWIVLALAAIAAFPSLGSVVRNDNATFLPKTAPSIRAQALAAPFIESGTESGVVVVHWPAWVDLTVQTAVFGPLEGSLAHVPLVRTVRPGAVAANGDAATVELEFSHATAGGGAAGARVVAAVRALVDRELPSGAQGYLTGSLPKLVDQQAAAAHTAAWVTLLSSAVILLLLVVAFRSVLAPLVALAPAALALGLAEPVIAESTRAGVRISSLLQLLLTALVLGAGTDYGLFTIFRYRECLGTGMAPRDAVVAASAKVGGTMTFSACTVVAALASLLLASFGLYRGVGPGLAIGIVVVLLVDLTLLPALLAVFGRATFWPSRPRARWAIPGAWGSVAARVCRRPLRALVLGVVALGCLAVFVLAYAPSGFNPGGTIAGSGSARGAALLSEYFGVRPTTTTYAVLAYRTPVWDDLPQVAAADAALRAGSALTDVTGLFNPDGGRVGDLDGIEWLARHLGPPGSLPAANPLPTTVPTVAYNLYRSSAQFVTATGREVLFRFALSAGPPGSTAAMQSIPAVRSVVDAAARRSGAVAVGVVGQAPTADDVSVVSGHDVVRIVPVVLVVLTLLLAIGLQSLLAPLFLVATVALSYLSALGVSILIFETIGGSLGVNFTLPFFLFIFVMALGEDYNILVMRRIREEAASWPPGEASARAVGATGSTVTAAGLVLASTFGVLAFTTSGQVRQIGAGLALGILLDTFIVRTLLVPSCAALLGRATWWPGRLWRRQPRAAVEPGRLQPVTAPAGPDAPQ